MTSNNSPLLKDSQKTKGTIWKPLIAISSLSIFSFISGQYLPYVIVAVSGSGAIAAVPLAIFAVSAVVALISTIYLIRLAVSRADNKKEVGLNGQKFGHTPSQEPQKFVCENCTSLENKPIGEELTKQDSGSQTEVDNGTNSRGKSSVSTPPPVTFGTQPSVSAPPPPPPPPPFGAPPPPSPRFFTASKRTEQPKNGAPKDDHSALFKQIREGIELKATNDDTTQENTPNPKNKDLIDELSQALKKRRGGISGTESVVQQPNNLTGVFSRISGKIPSPSHSSSVSSNGSEESKQDWSDEENEYSILQSDSESPDSGNVSGDDVHSKLTSPLPPEPKAEKPLILPKPVNLKTKSEAPPAAQVIPIPKNK